MRACEAAALIAHRRSKKGLRVAVQKMKRMIELQKRV